jgi:predicted GIY-YIG superfamily endonuclease
MAHARQSHFGCGASIMLASGRRQSACTIALETIMTAKGAVVMTEPEWMPKAVRAARTFQASTVGQAGAKHSVYVILLHDGRRRPRWGLYVGQTSRDPDWRFDQHKAGYKSSSSARRFGVCLLPHLVEHLNPLFQWESLDLEAALADAFRAAGVPWVEGGH